VWNVLLLEGRGKFLLKVAGVSKTASVEPAGRTRCIQIGEGMGSAIGLFNLGESKVAVHGNEPGQGRETIACTLENGWGV
jgi:hypothetical protein